MTAFHCDTQDLSILSRKEYEKYKHLISKIGVPWWLKTASQNSGFANTVYTDGNIYADTVSSELVGVRPVATIAITPKEIPWWFVPEKIIGKSIKYSGYRWTILTSEIDTLTVICDKSIKSMPFDSESAEWDESSLKKYLDDKKYDLFGALEFVEEP